MQEGTSSLLPYAICLFPVWRAQIILRPHQHRINPRLAIGKALWPKVNYGFQVTFRNPPDPRLVGESGCPKGSRGGAGCVEYVARLPLAPKLGLEKKAWFLSGHTHT